MIGMCESIICCDSWIIQIRNDCNLTENAVHLTHTTQRTANSEQTAAGPRRNEL